MTQITARKALLIAAILLIASVLITGAFALSIHNTLFSANLNGASFQFNYRPPVNGEYALYLHSQDGGEVSATAYLFEDDALIAEGSGRGAELLGVVGRHVPQHAGGDDLRRLGPSERVARRTAGFRGGGDRRQRRVLDRPERRPDRSPPVG